MIVLEKKLVLPVRLAGLCQHCDPRRSGKLTSLIRIHDFGRPEPGDGFVQSLDTQVRVHRV